ncbi:hypothetical protein HI914_07075 [Erysiphe necator]|nr:hypothetical protein HI914_07075 [Erysiphe necator]
MFYALHSALTLPASLSVKPPSSPHPARNIYVFLIVDFPEFNRLRFMRVHFQKQFLMICSISMTFNRIPFRFSSRQSLSWDSNLGTQIVGMLRSRE